MLAVLRKSRGLSQAQLAQMAGLSDRTVRRIEEDPSSARDLTWHTLLRALASVGQFDAEEKRLICSVTGWQADAVDTHNRTAVASSPPPDGRQTNRSRLLAVLDRAETAGMADQLLTIAESFAAALPPPKPAPDPLNPALFRNGGAAKHES